MMRQAEATVTLAGLSGNQRRLAERHLGLVHLTVRRMGPLCSAPHQELVQEGFLALAEAIRQHDPARHGQFPAYAMARVRFAVSRYLHEATSLIRVPYITQRRRRSRADDDRRDRQGPSDPSHAETILPRVVRNHDPSRGDPRRHSVRDASRRHDESEATLGDMARERYDRALRQAADRLARRHRHDPRRRRLLERCVDERWTIPEEECRTQIRRLARELSLSLGAVTRCEADLTRQVAAQLESDAFFNEIRRMARQRPHGWSQPIEAEEWATLRSRFPEVFADRSPDEDKRFRRGGPRAAM